MKKNYNFESNGDEKKIAKGYCANKVISSKYATELCNEIKGKNLAKVERYLENVLAHRDYIPFKKFQKKVAHRKGDPKSGVKSGRYADNTVKAFIKLLNDVKANADYKGLDEDKLFVKHAFASIGFRRQKNQPQGMISGKRREAKSTHLEFVLEERR